MQKFSKNERLMTETPLSKLLRSFIEDPSVRKKEFYRYYSTKRISHQLKQLQLLSDIPGDRITEIGSFLGFATALFMAAGFKVRTIDSGPSKLLGQITSEEHIVKNILDITADDVRGQDIIVCCETLEHLHYPDVEDVLKTFYASGTPWLLLSVPHRCLSMDVRLIKNPFSSMFKWIVKFPNKSRKAFPPDPEPYGHKWELGYKGYPLDKLTSTLGECGYKIVKTDYVGTVQSVFMLCQRKINGL